MLSPGSGPQTLTWPVLPATRDPRSCPGARLVVRAVVALLLTCAQAAVVSWPAGTGADGPTSPTARSSDASREGSDPMIRDGRTSSPQALLRTAFAAA